MSSNAQLQAVDLAFSYGPRPILRGISLVVAPGDCIGIVGPNGTGKTTLLRLLAGELVPEHGTVATNPPGATVGLLRQTLDVDPSATIASYIGQVSGSASIAAEFDQAVADVADDTPGAADRYDAALARFVASDVAGFDDRLRQQLDRVGLANLEPGRLLRELSGGQHTKVKLAAALLASFDILLLDEPTNDLDRQGLALIEQMVLDRKQGTVVVSHDRAFLERVVTSVYELDDHHHTGTRFNGGFQAWLQARDVAQQQHADDYAEYQDKRSRLRQRVQTHQEWSVRGASRAKKDKSEGDKFVRAHRIATSEKLAGKAKQTERALERLERNEKVEAPWKPWELQLSFEAADRSSTEVAVLTNAVVERGDFTLGPVNVTLTAGDRVLITGDNGAGKTTVLRALFGHAPLTSGSQHVGPSVKTATLRQGRALFAEAPSLLRGFVDAVGCEAHEARSALAKLRLDVERIDRPVADLSPGEQTRAALGLFAALGSNVLVLDEPTNHLDLPAIEQLEAALDVFPHTILLVTHDRRLMENARTNRRWHLEGGKLVES